MKRTLLFFIGLIFGLILLGLAVIKSNVLILSIPLVVYLFSTIYHQPEEIRLSVEREVCPENAPQGTPVEVNLTITNQGPAVDELVVKESFPEGIQKIEGKSSIVTLLAPEERVDLEYSVKAHRGQYDSYDVTVVSNDFSGFFALSRVYRTNPHLIIHPRYPKLDRIKVRPPQTRGFAGPIAARQGGNGIDFFGVREYQSGDPQRQINWKIAARSEQALFTNVFEQERVADVGIILDARQRLDVSSPYGSLFEHSVRAVAALTENFLSDGNRVSLFVYGSGIGRVFPGYGRVQKDRILKILAKTKTGMNYALDSLSHLPTRFFPAKSQIVLISPLSPEDIPMIVQMHAQGYAVMVVSPDPVAFASTIDNDANSIQRPGTGQAHRFANAERAFILQQVQRSGCQIVNWKVDQPLETTVREALSHQPLVSHPNRSGI